MEREKFMEIRDWACTNFQYVTEGKMMGSPAIHYKNKVFAFFSRKNKMVFKLGKRFAMETQDIVMEEFNPFTTKKPLSGWYEVDYQYNTKWSALAETALGLAMERR